MFKRKDDSFYEEGNGYRINDVPSDANYNTCSVKYTLNNDFSKNPQAGFNDSTNRHSLRKHIDVNASNNQQRPSGVSCRRPMSSQRPASMGGPQRTNMAGQRPMNGQRTMNAQRTTTMGTMNRQKASTSRPAVKKASPLGFLIFPIIIIVIFISIVNKEVPVPFIIMLGVIASIIKGSNKNNRRR